ncbi:MAG: ectoine synthase [bacterium]|nr:ectoine synthase [bacterium]
MIIRSLEEIDSSDRDVKTSDWRSMRLLLENDNMGFSLHVTKIPAGRELNLHYKNHLEAVYCTSGKAEVLDKATGATHTIVPGTVYALDQNDEHRLSAIENCEFVCVFNPPLTGKEVHDESGAYPILSHDTH